MPKYKDPNGLDLLGFKKCNKCGKWLPRTEYYKDKQNTSDWLKSWCKRCGNEHAAKWKKEHPEAHREASVRWSKKHPEYDREYSKRPMRAWKTKLRRETRQLIIEGVILHPGCCEECGVVAGEETIHIHHLTYLRPDRVLFLCTQCHATWHRENQSPPEPTQEWVEHWYETYNDYPEEGGIDGDLD